MSNIESPEAVTKLLNELKDARDVFDESKLGGQLRALWVLHDFLDGLGIDARLRAPLFSVIADLTDSDRQGAEKPIVEVVKMVSAAAALDTLIKAGMESVPAAREVIRVAGRAMSTSQLITFRKNLQRRRARREAVDMYHQLVQCSAERWARLSRKDRIREALLGVHGAYRAL